MSQICTILRPGDPRDGDLFELRWDLLGEDASRKLFFELDKPVLLTLRSRPQGGQFAGGREKVLDLARMQPAYLDLEYPHDVAYLLEVRKISPKTQCLLSFHGQEYDSQDLEELWEELRKVPADVYKIALAVSSSIEALKMLLFAKERKAPLIMVAMGARGQATRILAGKVGMPFTFAYPNGATAIAPGQLSVKELTETYGFYRIGPKTRPTGLIGLPVDGSIGHHCHNAVIQDFDLASTYIRFSLEIPEIPEFLSLAQQLDFQGLSVTMPLKEEVVKHLGCSTGDSINTLRWNGIWEGISTDGIGALRALGEVAGRQVLLIGAGGAAKAIARSLVAAGAVLTIWNRTYSRAQELAKDLGVEAAADLPKSCDLLVTTLPKGVPVPYVFANEMMDINLWAMAPWQVPFMNGKAMYLHQALEQVRYWWGVQDEARAKESLSTAAALVCS